jgi:hypothetical protein
MKARKKLLRCPAAAWAVWAAWITKTKTVAAVYDRRVNKKWEGAVPSVPFFVYRGGDGCAALH